MKQNSLKDFLKYGLNKVNKVTDNSYIEKWQGNCRSDFDGIYFLSKKEASDIYKDLKKSKTSKKVATIINIAHSESHCYKDLMPNYYNELSHSYKHFKQYISDIKFFVKIKDFSKIRGLENAWIQQMSEIYGPHWKEETLEYWNNYIEYFEDCQTAAEKFLENR